MSEVRVCVDFGGRVLYKHTQINQQCEDKTKYKIWRMSSPKFEYG